MCRQPFARPSRGLLTVSVGLLGSLSPRTGFRCVFVRHRCVPPIRHSRLSVSAPAEAKIHPEHSYNLLLLPRVPAKKIAAVGLSPSQQLQQLNVTPPPRHIFIHTFSTRKETMYSEVCPVLSERSLLGFSDKMRCMCLSCRR